MNTFKTALVVIVLLAVGYGVYVMLNKPPGATPPPGVEPGLLVPPGIELGTEPPVQPAPWPAPVTPSPPAPGDPSNPAQPFPSPTPPPVRDAGPVPSGDPNAVAPPLIPPGPNRPPGPENPYRHPPGNTGSFTAAWRSAKSQLEDGRLRDALFTLSILYGSPDITTDEHQRLVKLLDELAGTVIYSAPYALEPHHTVSGPETLEQIAQQYSVPWQFLAKVNGIHDPRALVPGQQLKVVRGPFGAEVNLQTHELTMFLGRYYAGRFPISVGNDPAPHPGAFDVLQKKEGSQDYFFSNGHVIAASDPANPYGTHWFGLSRGLAIHGSPTESRAPNHLGCISLSPGDAKDLFALLSTGSRVVIKASWGGSPADANAGTPVSGDRRVSLQVPGMW